MSKVKKIIIAALIFVVLAIVAMIPIPYVIESPGTAEEVSQFLTISGAKDEDPGSLRVLTVYVEQATVLTYFKKFLKHHEMVPAEEVFGDYTPEEFDALQDFSMRNARSKAVRVAFEAAGKTVERHVNGIFVTRVDPNSNFRDKLKVGDIIETIDGKSPGNTDESFEELRDYLASLEPGHTLVLQVKRDDATMTISGQLKMDRRTGGIRLGFEAFGCKNVFSSEWDKYAQSMYEVNFGEKPFGDINDISPSDIPDHDILLAGFPCQPFSIAGKGLGFADTRGTLFFNIEAILKAKKPKAFLLENVKRLTTHDNGNTFKVINDKLNKLGYTVYHKVLNTLDFGLPQKRERIYIVGFLDKLHFEFPKPIGKYEELSNILESDDLVPNTYFLSDELKRKRLSSITKDVPYPSIWHENISGNVSALPYSCALRAGGSYNYLVVNGVRRLTGREMLRLQGFPDTFEINIPYSQVRKVAGNSVSVPVIRAIAGSMINSLNMATPKISSKRIFR